MLKRSILLLGLFGMINLSVSGQSNNVGSINGKDIAFDGFRIKVANVEKNGQQGQQVSQIQAVNQAICSRS